MREVLLEILRNSEADDYEVTEIETTGWEFYFIRHLLDQNRAKKVTHLYVKVYKNHDGALGFASQEVPAGSTREEIEKIVSDLVYQASLVKNMPYELHEVKETEDIEIEVSGVREESEKFIRAFKEASETETEYLNSYEIFYNVSKKRFITSRGIDITETYPSSTLDVVINARNDEHEIELYRFYELGACDQEYIQKEIANTLKYGKDRLVTGPTPKLGVFPVVFSTDAALRIYDYFLSGLNTALVFRKMSSFEIGKEIAEDVLGDKVTIETKRVLPNSSENFRYDSEGGVVKDMVLLKDNVPQSYWGGRMFSEYMGVKDSFSVTNYIVSGGTKTEEELRSGNYLEIVEFSDFQVDDITGDIFGEIRLAYYHDGDKVIPVSGGSVSGDLREALKEMYMSVNSRQYNNAVIPAVTRLEKVTIAGVGEE